MTVDAIDRIASAASFLFVPGDRPDRFGKAIDSGADIVVIDLEDAVPASRKAEARESISNWLAPDRKVLVRVNGGDTEWFERDLTLAGNAGLLGFMLPKAEPGTALDRVASLAPTIAIIESAAGVHGIDAVAAVAGVHRLALGAIDLALDLDVTAPDAAFDPIRLGMTVSCRVAGMASPIEGVTTDFRDPERTHDDMLRARALGFGGKLCIHPAQVEQVMRALRPTEAQLAKARKVIEADRASGGAAVALDGQMIDRPVVERAYQLVARAK